MGPPKALTTCGPGGQRLHIHCVQCMPGPQGALVPDQGGPAGGGDDERVRHAERAGRRQPEDHSGADAPRAPHDTAARLRREYLGYEGQFFGTQQVEEYQEETRSHLLALCASTRGADLRPQRRRGDTFATLSAGVEQERAAGPKGGLWLRGRRCGNRGRCSRSWRRV